MLATAQWTWVNSVIQNYVIAAVAVAGALVLRAVLERFGHFYYLPMVPAVMVTAIVTGWRSPTLFAICLAIAANVVQVERDDPVDATVNALLFTGVCWLISEMCWRLKKMRARAASLSKRLARDNQMLDAILAATPIVTLDRDGRILMMTPPACAILGADAPSNIGRPFSDFVEAFTLDGVQREDSADTVWTAQRPNGQSYPLGIQFGVMVENPDGPYATVSLTDFTQAHAADARARDLNTQLNRVWRLNSLGEMAASLAHELNQPLTAAVNFLHASQAVTAKADVIGRSATQTIEQAKTQLLRAGSIIRRMRELLALESHGLAAERVGPMIADMHGILDMLGRNAGIAIEYQIDEMNDRVRAQRIQFQQAVLNLVRNAVEALAGHDNGLVRVVGRQISDERYELRVEDNGRGITTEELETIFRPLMTTKTAGMGLGLSVTRTIVESHGGVLIVERSELGGAAFVFSLIREHEMEDA